MYEVVSDVLNTLNQGAYEDYVRQCAARLKSDPKSFWRFVDLKRKNMRLAKIMTWNNRSATGHKAVANLLADFYASVYSIDQNINATLLRIASN